MNFTCSGDDTSFLSFGNEKLCQINSILEETLQAVGAKAMVVGHTPQTAGVNWYEATSFC